MRRLFLIVLIAALALAGCQPDTGETPSDPMEMLSTAAAAVQESQTFRLYVEQSGADFIVPVYLTTGQIDVEFRFARAQIISPDTLQATVRIVTPIFAMDIDVFSQGDDQWYRIEQLGWTNAEFAPGFNPVSLLSEETGFKAALTSLINLRYLGRTVLEDGGMVHHLRGSASGPKVSALVVGLLSVEGMIPLDVFIDAATGYPKRMILEIPDTETTAEDTTRLTIDVYDFDEQPNIVAPEGVNWTPPVIDPARIPSTDRIPVEALAQLGLLALLIGAAVAVPVLLWPRLRPSVAVADASAKPRFSPWVIVAIVSLPVFVGALDLTVVSAFLPELILDLEIPLQSGLDDAAWIVSGYLLAYAISMTFMGRVSDLLGRRAVYVICLIVFAVGSVLVAVAHLGPTDFFFNLARRFGQLPDKPDVTLAVIIAGRVIQALGAGALVPVSLALVADVFPAAKRARALGVIGAVDTLGWVLGHLYGGIAVQFMPWQGLFWINLPLTVGALLLTLFALRGIPDTRAQGRFDFIGALLIVLALAGLTLGLGANIEVGAGVSSFEELSPLPPYAAPVLIGAALSFLLFVLVERRIRDPLIDLKLLRRRSVSTGLMTNLFVGYVLFAGLVTVPILINVRQQSTAELQQAALQVGLMLSALTVPMALAAVPGGWLSERYGVRRVAVTGLMIAAAGFVLIWQTWNYEVSDWVVAAEMLIVGVGIGLTFSPISVSVINAADDHQRGVASALVIVLRLVGMTLSVSTITSIALTRVNIQLGQIGPIEGMESVTAAAEITVGVLAEVGLLAAIFCLIAAGAAALMPNAKAAASAHELGADR